MKKLTTAAILVGGAIVATQSAFGETYSSTPNDLLMGFQNAAGNGTEDYIINLGATTGFTVNSSVNLSSDFSVSDFDAVLGSSSSVQGGIIGAATTSVGGNNSSTADLYATQLRVGGAGSSAATPGSSAPAALTRTQDESSYSAISGTLASTTVGNGILDTGKSWEAEIDPGGTGTTWHSVNGINPDSTVTTSSVLYEDLWYTTSSSISGSKAFNYLGYFTLNVANDTLTFTGADVVSTPESATFGLLAGVGALLLGLRRQLTGVVA